MPNPMQMMGQMMGNNSPIGKIMQMARGGGNPMQILQNMSTGNPQMQQFLSNLQGKSSNEMREMAQNIAKERGINLEQFASQLGIKLPK